MRETLVRVHDSLSKYMPCSVCYRTINISIVKTWRCIHVCPFSVPVIVDE